jgi:glycosyltransferase involved in cell wall biosynthesis
LYTAFLKFLAWFNKPSPPKPEWIPSETQLRQWASSEWVEYQAWLFHNSFISLAQWQALRDLAQTWENPPLLSLVTPVFNTEPEQLRECVYSVLTQTYPHWELHLIDDGSSRADTLECLQGFAVLDARIKVQHLPQNQGICHATNRGIETAAGEFVAFLDHDDRIAPDALHHVAVLLQKFPDTDIVYSDRDMLSPRGFRFMHLFKPAWSPETLLSGNYLFHLLVYRTALLRKLDGTRLGFEGSQDYDLILRAAELNPVVRHLPKVLYHWRQHAQSVALAHGAKEYAYIAGIKALEQALQRRGLHATVSENKSLWRGNYRVHFAAPPEHSYQVVKIRASLNYAEQVNQAFAQHETANNLIFLTETVEPLAEDSFTELLGSLQIPEVALVTGKIVDRAQNLVHAGLVLRESGVPLCSYQGTSASIPGYMAATAILRNVSVPHPAAFALKRNVWEKLGGLNANYQSVYSLWDFALRALHDNARCVYTPFAEFIADVSENFTALPECERAEFATTWHTWLQQGDPYYNPHLTQHLLDMGLEVQPPVYEPLSDYVSIQTPAVE